MQFLPLLGKQLKDDEMIEVLDLLEADVIYDFDRLHEGQPDVYWASSKPDGLELKFDDDQRLSTIFLHVIPDDDFEAFSLPDCDIPFLESPAEVESFGATKSLPVSKGQANSLGIIRDWARLGFGAYSIHYEFHGDSLALVTVSRSKG